MSVLFGQWNYDGSPPAPGCMENVQALLSRYGPDGMTGWSGQGLQIFYFPFHTTKESRRETQPHKMRCGSLLTWDGRLDNRDDLIHRLGSGLSCESTDLAIAAAAYEQWGSSCLRELIGDWALAIWQERDRTLLLAKDFLGSRHLYYSVTPARSTWCTVLDPLLPSGKEFPRIEEEYIAGWLGAFPADHLTPYRGVHSVPAGCFVSIQQASSPVGRYFTFDSAQRIRYRNDSEYEEHLRAVFRTAVLRRLRSDSPIIAELSGGVDSSSIVCMADTLVAAGQAGTPRLDTVSYFDDSEPTWDERPYFTAVERRRGRTGAHIDLSCKDAVLFSFNADMLASTPCAGARISPVQRQFSTLIKSQGNRVVLSGAGGDEVTGGVPTPYPELADLLVSARFRLLARQLKRWALEKRQPWYALLAETILPFLPGHGLAPKPHADARPWLRASFAARYRTALMGYEARRTLSGALPSFQENVSSFERLVRMLESSVPLKPEPLCEFRYPYLDRDLLQFLYAIPREQLVRPGERRSLLRRALADIVPPEVLHRKHKAFSASRPIAALRAKYAAESTDLVAACDSLGIVDSSLFGDALQQTESGRNVPLVPILRTLQIEAWLRHIRTHASILVLPNQSLRRSANPATLEASS
jgi:asparagine synthase (glutamine-hydrolysing)